MRFASLPDPNHPLVRLRPLRFADLVRWSEYLNNSQVYEHTSWNHPTPDELAPYLGGEASTDPSARLRLAIAWRDSDRLAGTIGFHTVSPANRSAELAYELHPGAWGQGIASDMVAAMVTWAHAQASVLRVQATVLESNARSARVLERYGFSLEGLLRAYRLVRGKPGNYRMYAHLPAADVSW
ncbi:MAG: GNAT family N-acetyltransferase [Aquincola sp.]|nr:GNAT family N-acetyltransferase [Aquincola sp.]|tara:strand:- start:767 stop:1315 length:549 start_codon:yes stop_codon:yes gene_type:complete